MPENPEAFKLVMCLKVTSTLLLSLYCLAKAVSDVVFWNVAVDIVIILSLRGLHVLVYGIHSPVVPPAGQLTDLTKVLHGYVCLCKLPCKSYDDVQL